MKQVSDLEEKVRDLENSSRIDTERLRELEKKLAGVLAREKYYLVDSNRLLEDISNGTLSREKR